MLTSLLLLPTIAHGAAVTDLPPQFRGDIAVAYGATITPDTLIEGDATVGNRRTIRHDLSYTGRIGLMDFLALELVLPHAAKHEIRFSDTKAMVYDPIAESGTMRGTGGIEDSTLEGQGLGGTRIRIMGTPFSESAFAARGDQITWKLALGVQFADKTSMWTTEGGQRGAGPASPAFELQSFWSAEHKFASPYVGVDWMRRSPTSNAAVDIKDPSDLIFTAGLELPLWEDPDWANGLGTGLTLDLAGKFGYHTYGDGMSGVLLPTVLPISNGTAATQSETSSIWGHIDLRWRAARYVDWSLNGAMGGSLGHRIEHHYPVRSDTAGKMGWGLGTELTFRMRDPLFDKR